MTKESDTTLSLLETRISTWHATLQREYSSLSRIAIALYDADTDLLRTYVYSSDEETPLSRYEAKLSEVPSLQELAKTGERRVINDLSLLADSKSQHTQRILESGLRSSHTVPIFDEERLFGFLFYNSTKEGFFTPAILLKLRLYTDLISLVVLDEARPIRTLRAAVNTARSFAQHRDAETGKHLERMSRYARLIGRELAPAHDLSDQDLDLLFQLSPLHDVGKIAIPDHILLKTGRLTEDEFEIMKSHVVKGIEIVDMLIKEFGLEALEHGQMLRNIIAYHHEDYDGTGYPFGLRATDIPLEARITRVADVFDALTSERPYKKAWSNAEAIQELREQENTMFDPQCVAVIATHIDEIVGIQKRFEPDILG